MQLLLGKVASKPRIHHAPYLTAMTHLKLSFKNISKLQVPDAKDQSKPMLSANCPALQYAFLENNFLTDMAGAFAGLKSLVQINLHGNLISRMDCFDECSNLRRLSLENNRISRLEGLQNC